METIGLTEAAALLRMSEDALMRKARAGCDLSRNDVGYEDSLHSTSRVRNERTR